ncbi:MAG: hypothetical protein HKN14_05370 [Marinicaulis sp.]|nr:hypothetical protein [Marinicaulis sp.]NNE40332.1 hypothetical protein [Marinicaulis sp.]NNL88216.1 hypothetical protein [Marinicaulis sp.]
MKPLDFLPFALAALAVPHTAMADDEASNRPHVAAGQYGQCFAHSVPAEYYGVDGRTDLYAVGEENKLLHSYDWFAQRIFIACNVSDGKGVIAPAVVQLGPWPRGHAPEDDTLSIAFHYDGERVAEYSTLDIAEGNPKNASCSVSHYTVIAIVDGFSNLYSDAAPNFSLTTVDGRRLTFNILTGAIVKVDDTAAEESRGACP